MGRLNGLTTNCAWQTLSLLLSSYMYHLDNSIVIYKLTGISIDAGIAHAFSCIKILPFLATLLVGE